MKKLRLLLFENCNRSCAGCCNKQFDLANLPVCKDFSGYDEIMLTGGEPMLNPKLVIDTIMNIRYQRYPNSPRIYVYTAKVDDLFMARRVFSLADGMTVSLHEQADVDPFLEFAGFVSSIERANRLNIFDGIEIGLYPKGWKVKKNIVWIENCPLPQDEVFMRLAPHAIARP